MSDGGDARGSEDGTGPVSPAAPAPDAAPALAWEAGPGAGLALPRRLALVLGSTTLLLLGSPGAPLDGVLAPFVTVLGLALWALAASRVGPWRKGADWLAGALYGGLLMSWIGYVTPPSVVWLAFWWGFYHLLAGVLLRRLLHHVGRPLATGLVWTMQESLRTAIPTPLGISWVRAGHALDEVPLLRLAAAEVGVVGLGFLLASAGGLVGLALLRASTAEGPPWARVRAREMGRGLPVEAAWVAVLAGVLALLGAGRPALGLDDPDGAYARGPRALLVQPGLAQERKRELNSGASAGGLVDRQLALTLEGLLAEDEAGRTVDLVAWGETMLPVNLVEDSLVDAVAAGADLDWPTWDPLLAGRFETDARRERLVDVLLRNERALVGGLRAGLFLDPGGDHAAPWLTGTGSEPRRARAAELLAGAHVSAGAISWAARGGVVRRANAVALWGPTTAEAPAGERLGVGWKRHLVPGAESARGLEEHAWARAWAAKLMPYVPDMRAAARVGTLPSADGAWTAGVAVCFDNGFEDVFLESAADGNDFVLLASNEAWYLESHEFDQMLALSRLWAVESGRSIVRATNSGVSCQVAPDGSIPDLLTVDGKDRAVTGTLALDVVVPRAGTGPSPYTRRRPWVEGAALLLPWLLLALFELLDGRREVAARA